MAKRLRLAFMGTPEFAVPALRALLEAGHSIAAVYTQPPRPAGRGHRTTPSPVHRFAVGRGLPVRMPASLRNADEQAAFAGLDLDAAVVVAYGLLLPPAILAAPRLGCLNLHASLLPRWRGAAPIQRAILAGDEDTGVTIMRMDEGLDTGPILLAGRIAIGKRETAGQLHDRLAALGARLMVEALDGLAEGRLLPRPQPAEGATYARKLSPAEARLDWRRPAAELERVVRAFSPAPGAWFEAGGARIRVLAAEVAPPDGALAPGQRRPGTLEVACGDGRLLRLTRVQKAGGRPMASDAFLRGHALPPVLA